MAFVNNRIYLNKSRAYIMPGTEIMQGFSTLKLINTFVKCRKGLYKCWVKNHLYGINAQASIWKEMVSSKVLPKCFLEYYNLLSVCKITLEKWDDIT